MITRKRKAILMKAVSELKRADYTSEPELGVMYDRLADGRKQFAEVFDKNINAVMQISSLDLTMQHQTKKNCRYLEKNCTRRRYHIRRNLWQYQQSSGGVDQHHYQHFRGDRSSL